MNGDGLCWRLWRDAIGLSCGGEILGLHKFFFNHEVNR